MKTLISYFLLISLLVSACEKLEDETSVNYDQPFSTKVFVYDKGKFNSISKKDFLKKWEQQVYEMKGIDLTFENPKIVKQENGTLILVAKSTDGATKMATVVTLENGQIKSNNSSTCTCTGCAEGCDPEHISGNKWRCTPCSDITEDCEKSVTATTEPTPESE